MVDEVRFFSTLRLMPREVALTLSFRIGSNAIPAKGPLPFDRYFAVSFKPYVEPWFSRRGGNTLLDASKDHKHHYSLMFAITVGGVNPGQAHEPFSRSIGACIATRQGHFPRALATARMNAGVVPQQPPMMFAPASISAGTRDAKRSGVSR